MIKVISFDIGGTLIEKDVNDSYSLNELSVLVGKDYNLVKKVYKDVFQKKKGSLFELTELFCLMLMKEF